MITHQAFIDHLEEEVERQLQEAVATFQNVPVVQLLQPPAAGGWSIAECVAHLNTYAAFYHPRITRALAKAPVLASSAPFRHSWWGQFCIDLMDPDKGNRKYKAIRRHRPQPTDGAREVAGWIHYLEELQGLLTTAKEKNLMHPRVRSSLSPLLPLSVGDAIAFVATHNRRHLLQAHRVLCSLS